MSCMDFARDNKIPCSVIIVTRNEEKNIVRCLSALKDFSEIIVVDSNSTDATQELAVQYGAQVINFSWNGLYPKKRQWVLDNLNLQNDWVFWVDADEVVSPDCVTEIARILSRHPREAGFFVRGRYVWRGKTLRYGMMNNKIALMHKARMVFPVVDDLMIEGMGEIEGHYQPILLQAGLTIGQVSSPLFHFAQDERGGWLRRHERYARWEADMTLRGCWPVDPVAWREFIKRAIRTSVFRGPLMFAYSYFWKLGFVDGSAGMDFAYSRWRYCRLIRQAIKQR